METIMSIQFNMSERKAVESVLWLIKNGESDMYKIWKMLFSAEKYHLNHHGCPITGDRFLAMDYGTVPEWLYGAAGAERDGIDFFRQGNKLVAKRGQAMDYLAASDVDALKYGFDEYAGLDFNAVKEKNHKETAWKKNHVCNSNALIPFEDIIEEDWLKEDLSYMASSMVL